MGKKKSRTKQKKGTREPNAQNAEALDSPSDGAEEGEDQTASGNTLTCDSSTNQDPVPVVVKKSKEECNEAKDNVNEQNPKTNNECVQLPSSGDIGKENSSPENAIVDTDGTKKTNTANASELLNPHLSGEATKDLTSKEPTKSEPNAPRDLDKSQTASKEMKVQEKMQGGDENKISNTSNRTDASTPMKAAENLPAANEHGLPPPTDVANSKQNKELHDNMGEDSQVTANVQKLVQIDSKKVTDSGDQCQKNESTAADAANSPATLNTENNISSIQKTGTITLSGNPEIDPIKTEASTHDIKDEKLSTNQSNQHGSKQEIQNDIAPKSELIDFPQTIVPSKEIKGPHPTSSTETKECDRPHTDPTPTDKALSKVEEPVSCTVVKDEKIPTNGGNSKPKHQKEKVKKQKTSGLEHKEIKETLKSNDGNNSNSKASSCAQKEEAPADGPKEIIQHKEPCDQSIATPTPSFTTKENIMDAPLPINSQEVKILPCSQVPVAENQQNEEIKQEKLCGELKNEPIHEDLKHTEEVKPNTDVSENSMAQSPELASCPKDVIQHNAPSDQNKTISSSASTEDNTTHSEIVENENTDNQTNTKLNSHEAEILPCTTNTNVEKQQDNMSQSVIGSSLKDGVINEDITLSKGVGINPEVSQQSKADPEEPAKITLDTIPVKDSHNQEKAISAPSEKITLEHPPDTPTDAKTAPLSACTGNSNAKKQGKVNISTQVVKEGSKVDGKLKSRKGSSAVNASKKSKENSQEAHVPTREPVPEKDTHSQEKTLSSCIDIKGGVLSGQASECPIASLTDSQPGEASVCASDSNAKNQEIGNIITPVLSECSKQQAANDKQKPSENVSATPEICQQSKADSKQTTALPEEPVSEKSTQGQEKTSSSSVNETASSPHGKTALNSRTETLADKQIVGASALVDSKVGEKIPTQIVSEGLKDKTAKNKPKPQEEASLIPEVSQHNKEEEPKTEPETEGAIFTTIKKKDKKSKHVQERQNAEKLSKQNLQNTSTDTQKESKDPKTKDTKISHPAAMDGKKLPTDKKGLSQNECSLDKQENSCNPAQLDGSETPKANETESSKSKNLKGKPNNESDVKHKETNASEINILNDKNLTPKSTADKSSDSKQQKNKKKAGNTTVSDKSCSVVSEGTSISTSEKNKPSDLNQDTIKGKIEPSTVEVHSKTGINILHAGDSGKTFQARPIFMANTCHVCKSVHGGATRLKSCSACQLIAYCSKEHQRKHWKEHKNICQTVQKKIKQGGLQNLYANAHKITDPEEWRTYRCHLLVDIEKNVGRPLQSYEREMFLYPRVCSVCHTSDPGRLKVCKDCHFVNYCSSEHLPKSHHIWCKDLKLLLDINQYQSNNGLIKPEIPPINPEIIKIFPKNMDDFISSALAVIQSVPHFNLYKSALSDSASYPLTLLYAMNFLHNANDKTFSCGDKLTVHLVGAENQFEVEPLSKWDVFLLNLLPKVSALHLVFIGPELMPSNIEEDTCGDYKILQCKTTDPSKKLTAEFYYGKLYHDYAKESKFVKPDVICSFNCGIYRLTGFDNKDTWGPTISTMVKDKNIPILLTAYTEVEAPKDVLRFKQKCKITEMISPMKNPFASMRPNLNFVSDDETPLIFKNQYLSVVKRGD